MISGQIACHRAIDGHDSANRATGYTPQKLVHTIRVLAGLLDRCSLETLRNVKHFPAARQRRPHKQTFDHPSSSKMRVGEAVKTRDVNTSVFKERNNKLTSPLAFSNRGTCSCRRSGITNKRASAVFPRVIVFPNARQRHFTRSRVKRDKHRERVCQSLNIHTFDRN